ncbi:CPBP family intramembrane glutamic endopeptidase [Cephaloticoccus capnophilus]|nr:CPBP family intramembrane glutamic endopeptidase [Cephaloticoccus capnophilus]
MNSPVMLGPQIVGLIEVVFVVSGLFLLVRHVLSASGRKAAAAARARADTTLLWDISSTDFLLFIFCVITGGLLAQMICSPLLALFGIDINAESDRSAATLLLGGAFHGGMLAGVAFFRLALRREEKTRTAPRSVWARGLGTLLIALPLVAASALAWQSLLRLCGIEIHEQDLVGIFAETDSALILGSMALLAVVSAPITEELVFRAGLFRFLRTRTPRWVALALPALLFAAMHANLASFVPLAVLGIVFALAYERSGTIAVPILAHALFNLNTIVMILAGLGVE